ncbi:MAG: exodeoxyribonuclease VII small subunit [Lachnospiraceae bacterium]
MKKENEKTPQEENPMTVEEAFARLEEKLERLEQDDITLEESFQLYTEGMKLVKYCSDSIDRIEKKVLVMNESGEPEEL